MLLASITPKAVSQARSNYTEVSFFEASVYDDLARFYGQFSLAISLEVIEHLYSPLQFCKNLHALIRKGGTGIISTPYHGYLKNIAIAAGGRRTVTTAHFTKVGI